MMKVLLDSDTLLEFFLNRSGFIEDIEKLLEYVERTNSIELYITDQCFKKIDNCKSFIEDDTLGETIQYLENSLFKDRIIKIDRDLKERARKYPLPDFDSCLEVACVKKMGLDGIVTHNPSNFDDFIFLIGERIWSTENILQEGNISVYLMKIIKLEKCLSKDLTLQPKAAQNDEERQEDKDQLDTTAKQWAERKRAIDKIDYLSIYDKLSEKYIEKKN